MQLLRALDECFDERAGDVMEHRSDDFFHELAGKFIVQQELDLAGLLPQRLETPAAVELAEWPIDQVHFYQLRRVGVVFRREALFDSAKIDGDGRTRDVTLIHQYLGAATPGEELGIGGNVLDQRV